MDREPLKVLFLASEVLPFSKTGGLADVAGALPAALRSAGHDVTTVTPLYERVDRSKLVLRVDLGHRSVVAGKRSIDYTVYEDPDTGTLLFDMPELFDRPKIYTDGPDEALRFAAWSKAALEVISALGSRPDVIHANDWQSGTVPALVKGPMSSDPVVGRVPTVFTIHNLGYQGMFTIDAIESAGLSGFERMLDQDRLAEGLVSFLETAILHADAITTVSPTYAREIQTPDGGFGLDHLLRKRSKDLVGILNGIDVDAWNPRFDRFLLHRYSARSLWRKKLCKRDLLAEVGLPYRSGVPVVGLVSRLAHQKGIDLLKGPLAHFLQSWDLRLVVLGSGDPDYEAFFRWLAEIQPGKVSFTSGYDEGLSHRIEAGADIFLMPSLYEPCGLNQMYSLAYGTAPVVRRVGGLADTVEHFDPIAGTGNGFVFEHFSEDGLGWALGQALTTHTDQKSWQILQRNGMQVDNSWRDRAAEYEALYSRL